MVRDISLTSKQWNDLIFEGKNKDYGAYELRMSSSNRLVIAFLMSVTIMIFVSFLPSMIETVKTSRIVTGGITESTVLVDLIDKEKVPEELFREDMPPPPPPLKSTVQFTTPEIVDASELNEETKMKSQEDLAGTKLEISVATIEGTDEVHGVNIETLVKNNNIAGDPAEKEILTIVEQQPEFPGGTAALMRFLNENIKYPVTAAENGIMGRVTLKFVVNKNGEVSDVQIFKGIDPSLDKEALRVVGLMPKWIPGKQNGKAVNVYFNLPVTFVLQK